jgi:hypothetical protein
MVKETLQSEMIRLRKEQTLARQHEVYGGLSPAERIEYDDRAKRIKELDEQLKAIAVVEDAAAQRRHDWNQLSETDTPQSEARQPYRSREKDSTKEYTESLKTVRSPKHRNGQ